LDDECDAEPGNDYKWDTVEMLFASWSEYATSAGEKPGTKKAFSQSMPEKFKAGAEEVWRKAAPGVRRGQEKKARELI